MSRLSRNDSRFDDDVASLEFTRALFVAFGVVLLLGLVSGSIWIAWNLVKLHVLP